MNTNKIKTKGIGLKILCSFLLIVSLMISLLWILEIILFEPIYKNIQKKKVEEVTAEIIRGYGSYELHDYLDLSGKNNCNIVIFKYDNNNIEILYNTSRIRDDFELKINVKQFLHSMGTNTSISYISGNSRMESVNVGEVKTINNEVVYFYVNSIITPASSAIEVFTILLIIITVASLIIAILISIYLSKRISKPLHKISYQAKELSAGNLDIEFSGKGYEEVENLADTLNYAIKEIKKSENLQREVVQNVSHELKTPLTLIKSYTELIDDYGINNVEKTKKHTKIILEETEKLENLISDMIDLSKMQSKTLEYKITKFNLSESLEKFEEFYKSAHLEYEIEFSYSKNCFVIADKVRIEQVIVNFLNNAINYSQKDNKKILVSLNRNLKEKFIRFSVQDFGIGIAKEDKDLIFDRHFRSLSAKRAVVGSGVGLAIVKEILNFHKFKYGVESELGKGSLFYFDIPI